MSTTSSEDEYPGYSKNTAGFIHEFGSIMTSFEIRTALTVDRISGLESLFLRSAENTLWSQNNDRQGYIHRKTDEVAQQIHHAEDLLANNYASFLTGIRE